HRHCGLSRKEPHEHDCGDPLRRAAADLEARSAGAARARACREAVPPQRSRRSMADRARRDAGAGVDRRRRLAGGRRRAAPAAPDGTDTKRSIWLRPLDGDARPIPGTEGGIFPIWSPDSKFIAFFADGKLKKVDVGGAPPLAICDVQLNPRSGSWNKDGTIIF